MKATYLMLKNFVAIDTTLNIKKLEVDFNRMQHSILLFVGTNGSCKTYILSQIHPFAYFGNIDVRNGTDMIIDGKDGEKEIHFENDEGDNYVIHHYYIHKKSGRQIRSYIEKNGIELNKSGLVTSFNEIVEIEFGIDIGFLRILRLGSNVNNLVSSKSTERKDFAVKLLTEVDEYIRDFKESTQKARSLNTELKLVVEKLKKFGDEAETQLTGRIQILEEKIKSIRDIRENSIREIAKLKGIIESSINCSVSELRDKIQVLQQSKSEYGKKLSDIETRIGQINNVFVSVNGIDSLITELELEVNDNEKELSSIETRIEILSKTLVDLKNDSIDLDNQIRMIKELDDSDTVKNDLEKAREFDKKYERYYSTFKSTCTKEDILEDIAAMQTITDLLESLKEFSRKSREMYYKAYSKKKNPYEYCTDHLIKLRTELSLCNITKEHDEDSFEPPVGCELYQKCPFYKAIESKSFRSIQDIEKDVEVAEGAIKISEGIHNIEIMLKSRKKSIPIEVKVENIILDLLNNTNTFYNFDEAQHMVTFLEKFQEWKENKIRIEKLETELKSYEIQRSSMDIGVLSRQKNLMIRISDMEKELHKLHKKKKKLALEIEFGKEKILDANSYRKILMEKIDISDKLKADLESISLLEDKIVLLNNFDSQEWSHNQVILQADRNIESLEEELFDTKVKMREYRELQEKKQKLELKYTKTNLVRSAVSSTEGIPLLYLNLHFSRARNIANSIISSVYGDSIRLEKIVINEKEFRIPYSKNGVEIDDIVYASQGEVSVISLALSFALIQEFSGKDGYNILLLDEVDGPLDKSNKEKFLRVLDNQMAEMGCKQVFMISHNQLFENFPVDVFVTIDRDNQLDSYKNVNRIN